jgi:ABC-type glycerol-3-phosphate transport system substrate-binding protein
VRHSPIGATLIDMGAFIDNHQTYSWQEALPFMVQGDAAAYLMGNFAVAPLRDAGLTDDQLDFYQFPSKSRRVLKRPKMRQPIPSTFRPMRRTKKMPASS